MIEQCSAAEENAGPRRAAGPAAPEPAPLDAARRASSSPQLAEQALDIPARPPAIPLLRRQSSEACPEPDAEPSTIESPSPSVGKKSVTSADGTPAVPFASRLHSALSSTLNSPLTPLEGIPQTSFSSMSDTPVVLRNEAFSLNHILARVATESANYEELHRPDERPQWDSDSD